MANNGDISLSHEKMRAIAKDNISKGQALDDLLKRIDSKMMRAVGADGALWRSGASEKQYEIFKREAANFPKFLEKITRNANFVIATVDKNIADDQKIQSNLSNMG